MTKIEWVGDGVLEGQVNEREFVIDGGSGPIPGIIWMPEEADKPLPLVLFGHGGSGHKRVSRALMLGRRFAGVSQFAMVAIDGPAHGGRKGPGQTDLQDLYAERGLDNVIDGMVDDWSATLACFSEMDLIDADQAAYVGFSMGCRFGLPFVAAAGDKLKCAVLGKNALERIAEPDGQDRLGQRFKDDAPNIHIPLLFHVQWDDELFARDSQFALFDLISSTDKRMICYPGAHAKSSPEAVDHWCGFVENHLRA